jgi:hypothetical protein
MIHDSSQSPRCESRKKVVAGTPTVDRRTFCLAIVIANRTEQNFAGAEFLANTVNDARRLVAMVMNPNLSVIARVSNRQTADD